MRSAGALPGGRILALNSGAASLPVSTPGLCWEEKVTSDMYFRSKREKGEDRWMGTVFKVILLRESSEVHREADEHEIHPDWRRRLNFGLPSLDEDFL